MIQCNLGKIWKTNSPRYPENTFPEVFCIRLSFLHLLSNRLNEDCGFFYKVLWSIISKGKQPFDFIKPNIIWKLTYKVKYISQIN